MEKGREVSYKEIYDRKRQQQNTKSEKWEKKEREKVREKSELNKVNKVNIESTIYFIFLN